MKSARAGRGFTLIEAVGVAVTLIIMLGGALVIGVRRQRRLDALRCDLQRETIHEAVLSWHSRDYSERDEIPTWEDLVPAYLDEKPKCPSGAEITIGGLETMPKCLSGLEGHAAE